MKRKRLNRDIWQFDHFPYYQLRVDTSDFNGLVCLIKLQNGVAHIDNGDYQYWNFPKAGKAAVCGDGMTWLQLIPDGKSHVLTAKYLPDNKLSICYTDIIERIEYDPDGVAVFIDKYLDVVFTPQGDCGIDDRDELDDAFHSGELSRGQYDAAIEEGDAIIEEYCTDIARTEAWCDRILAHVNDRIDGGERAFLT